MTRQGPGEALAVHAINSGVVTERPKRVRRRIAAKRRKKKEYKEYEDRNRAPGRAKPRRARFISLNSLYSSYSFQPADNTSDVTCGVPSLDRIGKSRLRSGSRFATCLGDVAATIVVDRVIQRARCDVVVVKIPHLPSEEN